MARSSRLDRPNELPYAFGGVMAKKNGIDTKAAKRTPHSLINGISVSRSGRAGLVQYLGQEGSTHCAQASIPPCKLYSFVKPWLARTIAALRLLIP